jgi:hypothetical protein
MHGCVRVNLRIYFMPFTLLENVRVNFGIRAIFEFDLYIAQLLKYSNFRKLC